MQITIPALPLENFYQRSLPSAVYGTCSAVVGSATLSGNFTRWVGLSGFKINVGGSDYMVVSVDPTVMTISPVYAGTQTLDVPFTVYPIVLLRIYALQPFTAQSDLQTIQPGAPSNGNFYKQVGCSVISNTLYLPELQLESTTDAVNPGDRAARYFAGFYRQDGALIQPYYRFEQFMLMSVPDSQSWAAIAAYNSPGVPPPPNYDTYSKNQINQIFNALKDAAGVAVGGPVTGGTPQSVLFVDSAGKLGQDHTDFRWDAVTNRLHLRDPAIEDMGGKISCTATDGGTAAVFTCFAPTYAEVVYTLKQAPEAMRNTVNGMLFSQLTLISDPVQGPGKLKPQDGFGHRYEFQADTDVTAHRICLIDMFWTTVAEATRTSALALSLCDNGSTALERFRFTPAGLTLPADPTLAMHAVTKQYLASQTGAYVPLSGGTMTGELRVNAAFNVGCDTYGQAYFNIRAFNDTLPPVSAFYAIHTPGTPRFIYFGRSGYGVEPQMMAFYTSLSGYDDYRRMYIANDGSVHINEQSVTASANALTVWSGRNGGFANAFYCGGPSLFNPLPTFFDGATWCQVKIGAAGTGPGGVGRMLYVD